MYFWNSLLLSDIRVQRLRWVNRWTTNNDLCFHIYLGMLYLAVHVSNGGNLTSWCKYNIWQQLTHIPQRKPCHSLNSMCKRFQHSDKLPKFLYFDKSYTKMFNTEGRRLRQTSDCCSKKYWTATIGIFFCIWMNCNNPWIIAGLWLFCGINIFLV